MCFISLNPWKMFNSHLINYACHMIIQNFFFLLLSFTSECELFLLYLWMYSVCIESISKCLKNEIRSNSVFGRCFLKSTNSGILKKINMRTTSLAIKKYSTSFTTKYSIKHSEFIKNRWVKQKWWFVMSFMTQRDHR